MWGWTLGLKALAIYRDGSKLSQPLSTKSEGGKVAEKDVENEPVKARPTRERLPDTRQSITHKFNVGGHEGYINVGLYPDGRPGELFITMAKEGSTIGGLIRRTSVSQRRGTSFVGSGDRIRPQIRIPQCPNHCLGSDRDD